MKRICIRVDLGDGSYDNVVSTNQYSIENHHDMELLGAKQYKKYLHLDFALRYHLGDVHAEKDDREVSTEEWERRWILQDLFTSSLLSRLTLTTAGFSLSQASHSFLINTHYLPPTRYKPRVNRFLYEVSNCKYVSK